MNLRNLQIGTRLGLGMGVMLLSAFLMLVGSVVIHDREKAAADQTAHALSQRRDAVLTTRQALMASAVAVRNIGLNSSVEGVQAAEAVAKKERAAYLAGIEGMEKLGLSDAGKALVAKMKGIDARMARDFSETVELASMFNTEQAAKLITTKIDPATGEAVAALGELASLLQTETSQAQAASAARTTNVERALALVGLVLLMGSAVVAWGLARGIVRPIQAAMAVAGTVAAGDLSSRIQADGGDETGRLLGSLAAMTAQLSSVVGQVRQATHSIATASGEIASGNQDLSNRTEQTAASLQQAASSLQQMTQMVQQLAASAAQAHQLANDAAAVAGSGGEVVSRVVSTMAEIQGSSRRIADITGVIDGIAFQTNILALNAAVEAARAGEQGRGFAVVASEVRSLAQRSAQAAREIKSLISASVEKVDAGSQLASDAGQTMDKVVGAVQRVNQILGDITRAADQQSSGIGEVNSAVSRLDQMTQQNAALVEQSTAAAESMKAQAQQLSGLVNTFKLA